MTRNKVLFVFKSILAALVLGAVARQFAQILTSDELKGRELSFHLFPLALAGFAYLAAHTIWATFWHQLLREQGITLSWPAVVRVYFASQLGKYVPGKAWVLVIRVALCRRHGIPSRVLAVSAAYETLTNMAAGALLAVCLLPSSESALGIELVSNKGFVLIGIAGIPIGMVAVGHVAGRIKGNDALATPSMLLLARGFLQSFLGWAFLALGLRLVLIAADLPLSIDTAVSDLAAITLSYIAGFVVLVSPGGLGAREFVLQQVLSPRLASDLGGGSAAGAVVIALVLRLVWTAFEVIMAFGSWIWERRIGSETTAPSVEVPSSQTKDSEQSIHSSSSTPADSTIPIS